MDKIVTIYLISLFLLTSCQSEEIFIYWTDETDNQIQRLDKARIKYEIRNEEIWINEKDLIKVVAYCS